MDKIAIFAGAGTLPSNLLKIFIQKNIMFFTIIINPEVLSSKEMEFYKQYPHITLKLGQVGEALKYLEDNNIRNVIFAGKVKRPSFGDIKVDFQGSILLKRILMSKFKGDDTVLQIVADFFEQNNIKVHAIKDFLPNFTEHKGFLTKKIKDDQFVIEAKNAVNIAKQIGQLDIGQAIIYESGVVLGVEAAEGTDNLIKRSKEFISDSDQAMLVKICKPQQDERMDLPTIGPNTVKNAAENNIKNIIIESGRVVITDYQQTIELADNLGVLILSVKNSD